jgi:predicted GNAT family acetyltransferase
MPSAHPLDRPAWSALTTRQASLSLGDPRALRFAPDYAPFAGAADTSPESLAALAALPSPDGTLWVVEAEPPPTPPGMTVTVEAPCLQMIATALAPEARAARADIVDLTEADAPEMRALAALTRPGPFSTRTHELGPFVGVKIDGRLAAMAGERMKPTGFTEVSGVCTHPGHVGHGYGGALTRVVTARILARGETAFLHSYASNPGAVRLYESLGFTIRRTVIARILAKT